MAETRYAWSTDEEHYYGDEPTREDAVAAAHKDQEIEPGQTIYTGEITRFTGVNFAPHAYDIVERMEENAAEDAGECSDQWLTPLPEGAIEDLDARLELSIGAWLEKYDLVPKFFTADKIVEHRIPVAVEAT